ncbi:MAG: transcription elongation factor Spt5 [Candidatus Lokiarchaeota archaeon]|nr:transcription elongation factor Spt5 [Candidatus Lokiarchaeota archaeon]
MQSTGNIYAVRTTIGQEKSVGDLIRTAVTSANDIWVCPFCEKEFDFKDDAQEHIKECQMAEGEDSPERVSENKLLGRVKAVLVPGTLRGYIFLETMEFRDVELAIQGIPHVRGRVGGKVTLEEIDKFLVPPPAAEGISVGDLVEIISGAFKGERAKVVRVESAKGELILELLDSPHTIPIRVHADFAKLVEKAEPEEDEEEEGEEESGFWAK